MAEVLSNALIDEYLFEIIILGAVFIGIIILYKKLRIVPKTPDFVRVFRDQLIRDEVMNKPSKYEPRWFYYGDKLIGRIISYDRQNVKYNPPKQEKEAGMYEKWEKKIVTMTIMKKTWWKICLSGKEIIMFQESEAEQQKGRKLVIPSDLGLTALGQVYSTKSSYHFTSRIIEGDWNKRLLEANANVMASRMSHIAQETPEMAHELSMKRLDIDRIRAEKESKVSGLI